MLAQIGKDPDWRVYLGVAVFLVGLAWTAMRWIARTIQSDLDTGIRSGPRKSLAMQAQTDPVPPALVKKALEKGLVSASQLATMNPTERQFLFASLRVQLEATGEYSAAGRGGRASTAVRTPRAGTPASPVTPVTPDEGQPPEPPRASQLRATRAMMTPPTGIRPSQAMNAMSGASFGMAFLPVSEDLKVHCPSCGTLLRLPAFAPFVTHCEGCGNKTAVRREEGGRLVLTMAPPVVPRLARGDEP